MKRILMFILMIIFMSIIYAYGARLVKIGYVDVEEVFAAYPGTADIRQKLKEEKDKFQAEIDKKKEEIAIQENDFQNNYERFNDEERQRREAEIEYKKELLSEFIDDSNKKLTALKDELTKPVYIKIYTIIQKVSAEKGFSFVFRKGSESILYLEREFDLTKDVISRLAKELSIEERN